MFSSEIPPIKSSSPVSVDSNGKLLQEQVSLVTTHAGSIHRGVALELNRIGVELHEAGYYDEASETFRESIAAFKIVARYKNISGDWPQSHVLPPLHEDFRIVRANARLSREVRDTLVNQEKRLKYDIQQQTYPVNVKKTLQLNSEGKIPNCDMNVCFEESAIVVYNLAVTQHSMGSLNGDHKFLEKALSLYKMVGNLLSNKPKRQKEKALDNDAICALMATILRNMGELYCERGLHKNANKCFQAAEQWLTGRAPPVAPAA